MRNLHLIITLLGAARGAVAIGFYNQITGSSIGFFELSFFMLPIGALMVVLGLLFLRNTGAAALTLTLLAGVIFLTAGIVRLMAAFHDPLFRVPLVLSGVASTILGLVVLFDLFDATYVLLGTLLGVYSIVDGITMMAIGRWRVVQPPESDAEAGREDTSVDQAHIEMPSQRKPAADEAPKPRHTQPH